MDPTNASLTHSSPQESFLSSLSLQVLAQEKKKRRNEQKTIPERERERVLWRSDEAERGSQEQQREAREEEEELVGAVERSCRRRLRRRPWGRGWGRGRGRASCAGRRRGCTAGRTTRRSAGGATRRCTGPTSWWPGTRARCSAAGARGPRRGAPRGRDWGPRRPSASAAGSGAVATGWPAARRTRRRRWSWRRRRTRKTRRKRARGRTRSCRGRRRTRRPRRRPSRAPRRAATGKPPPSAQRTTCRAGRPGRACATTRRQLATVAGATRPLPPGTAAVFSPPPGTGRDHPRISSAWSRRSQGVALWGGIAPVRPLVEMTFHEAN